MTNRHHRITAGAVLAAAALVLAGCGGSAANPAGSGRCPDCRRRAVEADGRSGPAEGSMPLSRCRR